MGCKLLLTEKEEEEEEREDDEAACLLQLPLRAALNGRLWDQACHGFIRLTTFLFRSLTQQGQFTHEALAKPYQRMSISDDTYTKEREEELKGGRMLVGWGKGRVEERNREDGKIRRWWGGKRKWDKRIGMAEIMESI